jgi:hypothetical protein
VHPATASRVTPHPEPLDAGRGPGLELATAEGEGLAGPFVIFQLGGAVLAAGHDLTEVDARVRALLERYGQTGLARRLPAEDAGIDLRGTTIRVWEEGQCTIGALYRACCDDDLVRCVARGERLEVPYSLSPGEPIVLREGPVRLHLEAAPEVLVTHANDADETQERPLGPAPKPFTAADIIGLREFGRDPALPTAAVEQAVRSASERLLRSFASLVSRPSLDGCNDLWLAKAARQLARAADCIDNALRFGPEAPPGFRHSGHPAAPSLRAQMAEREGRA